MNLAFKLVFKRLKKQKIRNVLVVLAIAAASCLVVWIIGGYETLFTDMIGSEDNPLGRYNLKTMSAGGLEAGLNAGPGGMPQRGRGGGFSGPFQGPRSQQQPQQQIPDRQKERPFANSSMNPSSSEKKDSSKLNSPSEVGNIPADRKTGKSQRDLNFNSTGSITDNKNAPRSFGQAERPENFQNRPPKDRFEYARTNNHQIDIAKIAAAVPDHILKKFKALDKNNDGFLDNKEEQAMAMNRMTAEEMPSGRPGSSPVNGIRMNQRNSREMTIALPKSFIDKLRTDQDIETLDESAPVRAFVYYKGMKSYFSSNQDDQNTKTTQDEIGKSGKNENSKNSSLIPDGVDPELHFEAFKAYRASMGTPAGMGQQLLGTTARQAPYKMASGSWFSETDSRLLEAVVTSSAAEKMKIHSGDKILLICDTGEYQLNVVGVIEDRAGSFYLPMETAEKIKGSRPDSDSVSIILRKGSNPEEFKKRWNPILQQTVPGTSFMTAQDIKDLKKKISADKKSFNWQTVSSALMAIFVSAVIIFTTLNMSVHEQKRQFALLRGIGLTRYQIGQTVLSESLLLALPGWLFGLGAGWLLLGFFTGKLPVIGIPVIVLTFICSVLGAIIAAIIPVVKGLLVRPLDALENTPFSGSRIDHKRNRRIVVFSTCLGFLLLSVDILIVHFFNIDTKTRLFFHASLGIFSLALGMLFLIPMAVKLTEWIFVPLLAFMFRLDPKILRNELSGNLFRTSATAAALSIGGGIFIAMQIWGYSMLGPFLPGKEMPDSFAAFLPNGLRTEMADELRNAPFVIQNEFLPVAVEQAEFAKGSLKSGELQSKDRMKNQFANVILFGADTDKAFGGNSPMIELRFRKGNIHETLNAMKNSRGCVITDTVSVDYKLDKGDLLKLVHPRIPSKIIEYPIVGVVHFPGSQWFCKTSGVRRNFARSGGMVFLSDENVLKDFGIERFSYFWFNSPADVSCSNMERELDQIAAKNFRLDKTSPKTTNSLNGTAQKESELVFVKLTTRDSLCRSIFRRADGVIWGISTLPLVTLVITSIAVISVIVNSVRSRRWQFGIMRSIGFTRSAIVRLILIESALVGIIAIIASFVFGFLSAQGGLKLGESMFGSANPPIILPWSHLAFGIGLMIFLCLLAALEPAINTGRKEPLDLLQEGRGID